MRVTLSTGARGQRSPFETKLDKGSRECSRCWKRNPLPLPRPVLYNCLKEVSCQIPLLNIWTCRWAIKELFVCSQLLPLGFHSFCFYKARSPGHLSALKCQGNDARCSDRVNIIILASNLMRLGNCLGNRSWCTSHGAMSWINGGDSNKTTTMMMIIIIFIKHSLGTTCSMKRLTWIYVSCQNSPLRKVLFICNFRNTWKLSFQKD